MAAYDADEVYVEAEGLAGLAKPLQSALGEFEIAQAGEARQFPIFAFAEIGRAISDYWDKLSDDTRRSIFDRIETLIVDPRQSVQDAVATGLIEALVNCSDMGDIEASALVPFLGPQSKVYWRAWDKFNGCTTPGLDG
jgi:hypothetical protein